MDDQDILLIFKEKMIENSKYVVKSSEEIFKKTHIKAMKWKKFFNSISGCIVKFGVEVSMQFKVLNEALKLYMKHKFIIWKHLRSFITSSSKI